MGEESDIHVFFCSGHRCDDCFHDFIEVLDTREFLFEGLFAGILVGFVGCGDGEVFDFEDLFDGPGGHCWEEGGSGGYGSKGDRFL